VREWIEQAITNYCIPTTFSKSIAILGTSNGNVLAVNVPPSLSTIYVWDREANTMEVVGRNNLASAT
jgi:hypothetical protein